NKDRRKLPLIRRGICKVMFQAFARLAALASLLLCFGIEAGNAQQNVRGADLLCGGATSGRTRVLVGTFFVAGDRNNDLTRILDKIFVGVISGLLGTAGNNVSVFVWDPAAAQRYTSDAKLIDLINSIQLSPAQDKEAPTALRDFLAKNN